MVEEPDKVHVQLYARNGYVYTSFYWKVPLRNKDGDVVDHAKVSVEDYQKVMKYKWNRYISKTNTYATGSTHGDNKRMHLYILGSPNEGFCVDHLSGDGLDNTKNNIWFATIRQNNQNRIS